MPIEKYRFEKLRFPFVDVIERTIVTDDNGKVLSISEVNLSKEESRKIREDTKRMKEIQRQEDWNNTPLSRKILVWISLLVIVVSVCFYFMYTPGK